MRKFVNSVDKSTEKRKILIGHVELISLNGLK